MRLHGWLLVIAACSKSGDPVVADNPKHEDRNEPAVAAPALSVEIVIGDEKSTWDQAAFDKVPHVPNPNNRGEARETWSLRDLVHQLVGPMARVVAVTGSDGEKQIDAASWDAAERTPILHKTRRGTLKFRWADKAGTWGPAETNDVTRITVDRMRMFHQGPADIALIRTKKYAFEAYPSWSVDHPDAACPASITDLDKYMPPAKDTKDPWGGAYAMFCGTNLPAGAKGLAVMSPGPDGKVGTGDDIKSWE